MNLNSVGVILIGGGVATICLIVLVAAGEFGVMGASGDLDELSRVHDKSAMVREMRAAALRRVLSLSGMVASGNAVDAAAIYPRYANAASDFIMARTALESHRMSIGEADLLEQIKVKVRHSADYQVEVIRLLESDRREAAATHLNEKVVVNQVDLLDLLTSLDQRIEADWRNAKARGKRSMNWMSWALALFGVLAVALVAWMTRFVSRRIRSAERLLVEEKESVEVTLNSVGDAVVAVNDDGVVTYINGAAKDMLQMKSGFLPGRLLADVLAARDEKTGVVLDAVRLLDSGRAARGSSQGYYVGADGADERVVEVCCSRVGDSRGWVLVLHDVTKARNLSKQLRWQATHDSLTGVTNRRHFEESLASALENAKVYDHRHVMIYIDLDQFKLVNDTCGHVAGDELLRQLCSLLIRLVKRDDVFARLGGDEFGLLLHNCDSDTALNVAETLRDTIGQYRFFWDGRSFNIGASMGIVAVTSDTASVESVMSASDAACYMAKDRGRNRVWVHRENDHDLARRKSEMGWVSEISRALEEGRFCLYRQRIAHISDRSLGHYEVLIRMLDRDGKIIPPMAFIPAAERYSLMPLIDRWVVTRTLEKMKSCCDDSYAINMSGSSISDDGFAEFLLDTLESCGVEPGRLCFEVTETAAISNLSVAADFIAVLRGKGYKVALDDFGSGMSSFAYLKDLPIDFIKIDGAFVRNIHEDKLGFAMVQAMNSISHVMEIETIAEFVENERIAALLQSIGVDYVQGYGIHKPEPWA